MKVKKHHRVEVPAAMTIAQTAAAATLNGVRYTIKDMRILYKAHLVGSLEWGPLYWFRKDRSMACLLYDGRVAVVRLA